MSNFREVFREMFQCEYPGNGLGLSIPRLRFELAHGPKHEALQVALDRCRALLEAVCRSDETAWVELCLWSKENCVETVRALEMHGLKPLDQTSWERENHLPPNGELEDVQYLFSAEIPCESEGFETLLRAIVLGDHGGYKDLFVRALVVAPKAQLGFLPYDDRGADLFALEAASLLPLYHEFESWILDYDRPRIEEELRLDEGA